MFTTSRNMSKASLKFRNFCFTNYDLDVPMVMEHPNVQCVRSQHEMCPKTNRRHIQGYCELKNQMTIGAIQKKLFGGVKVHIERRRGTQEQAVKYCQKLETSIPGTQVSYGELHEQGSRSDLEAMVAMLKDGSGVMEVIDDHPQVIRFVRNIQLVASLVEPPVRNVEVEVMTPEEIFNLEDRPYFYTADWSCYDNQKSAVLVPGTVDLLRVLSGERLRFSVQGQPTRVCHIEKVYFLKDERYAKPWYSKWIMEPDGGMK